MKILSEKMMATEEIDDPLIPITSLDGTRVWQDEKGLLHREDGPAFVSHDLRTQYWCKHGKIHRVGGPAIIKSDRQIWMIDGTCHREDGPAITGHSTIGHATMWYLNGHLVGEATVRALGKMR